MDPKYQAAIDFYHEAMNLENNDHDWACRQGFESSDSLRLLKAAQEVVEKAQARLESVRRGIALRIAVDALMPGWVDIDAGDYLPKSEWFNFIAQTKEEWVEYLKSHGLDNETIETLMSDQWMER